MKRHKNVHKYTNFFMLLEMPAKFEEKNQGPFFSRENAGVIENVASLYVTRP